MIETAVSGADRLHRVAQPLRYLYFRIYAWNLRKQGESDFPQYNALLGTSFLMLLNLLSIPLILDSTGVAAVTTAAFRNIALVLMPVTFAVQYALLVRGGRYRIIRNEFANETEESSRRGAIVVWSYIVISFGIFFGIAMAGAIARSKGA
jgi:hypothetical protein